MRATISAKRHLCRRIFWLVWRSFGWLVRNQTRFNNTD